MLFKYVRKDPGNPGAGRIEIIDTNKNLSADVSVPRLAGFSLIT